MWVSVRAERLWVFPLCDLWPLLSLSQLSCGSGLICWLSRNVESSDLQIGVKSGPTGHFQLPCRPIRTEFGSAFRVPWFHLQVGVVIHPSSGSSPETVLVSGMLFDPLTKLLRCVYCDPQWCHRPVREQEASDWLLLFAVASLCLQSGCFCLFRDDLSCYHDDRLSSSSSDTSPVFFSHSSEPVVSIQILHCSRNTLLQ